MGKQIGEFAFKAITFIVTPGLAGTVQMQATFEGSATGFGLTLGTMTVSCSGPGSGIWDWCGVNYPDSGECVSGTAQGHFNDRGAKRWHTRGVLTVSDGRSSVVDGEFDLTARTWNGRLLERD